LGGARVGNARRARSTARSAASPDPLHFVREMED
jgi:serine/threonine protein kinase